MSVVLKDLARKSRLAETDRELGFSFVNDTMSLVPYRQAALWLANEGCWCLSGVVQVDANVPYVQWLDAVSRYLHAEKGNTLHSFTSIDLPSNIADKWGHWWPQHAVWLGSTAPGLMGAGILVRDTPWLPHELNELQEWSEIWWHAFYALHRPRVGRLRGLSGRISNALVPQPGQPWWRQRRWQLALIAAAFLFLPVRLTVLAPGELVPAHPQVVRAPLDGVIDVFHVQPNQQVKADQPLFSFDEIVIKSRLEVALQSLATAETDYRQTSQLALTDAKFKTQLAMLVGKIEERHTEIDYLHEQLARASVLSPGAGVVLMDDPSEWIGKPLVTGERILRIAALDDAEVEAWVPLADAINMAVGDDVTLYLSTSPLSPVSASLRYMAHDAVQRPDGAYAYRVRAILAEKTTHRVGLKGTAKLHAGWVPLSYWVFRRPWAAARAYMGW